MKLLKFSVFWLLLASNWVVAHERPTKIKGEATYLGNEGVMITSSDSKILFDPFFHKSLGQYQLVPEKIRKAIFNGQKPYDNIDAIFISHAHGDHFSVEDVHRFLKTHPKARLVAPTQAVDQLKHRAGTVELMPRVTAVTLKYDDKPWKYTIEGLEIEAVRIPHAGGQTRRYVENIVFRVTLNDSVTVMHMGDADPNDGFFKPYNDHWQKKSTDTAFPPYWFMLEPEGNYILDERINAKKSVGVHVPTSVPYGLRSTGKRFFSIVGETEAVGQ